MNDIVTLICGAIQLAFVLWFTFSVVEKLKRSEQLLRELLRTANPDHPEFREPTPPPQPVPVQPTAQPKKPYVPYTAEQIKKTMASRKLKPGEPYIC